MKKTTSIKKILCFLGIHKLVYYQKGLHTSIIGCTRCNKTYLVGDVEIYNCDFELKLTSKNKQD
jgi:hypothetical protein